MSLLLLFRPQTDEGVPEPVPPDLPVGGRPMPARPGRRQQIEDDELVTWIQTHRPDPLRRR